MTQRPRTHCNSGAQTCSLYAVPAGGRHTVTIGARPMSCSREARAMPIALSPRLLQ
jgi:hypothetical protein